ncbi:MAG: 16S rRNA (uracil(1498)-N(3))-methyltransferase [Caryophanon sp.]|nr:16S rRNA (uracil(1498)-N(3))-methyltransferase [Caryophanon sp.]
MQRYFSEQPFENEQATLTGDSAKHIAKVMRMNVGDEIIVVSEGVAHICRIANIEQDVTVTQTGRTVASPEMPVRVTIACGLPKGDKLELITQKGTELGMFSLQPFKAERSIVKWDDKKGEKKTERLQKIALEAAEQSHRTHVPLIENPISFKQLVATISQYDVVFIADEEDAKQSERTKFADKLRALTGEAASILCIFGPEGGIARSESEALLAAGAQTMSLGPRILRAETAPLYALAAISYEFE